MPPRWFRFADRGGLGGFRDGGGKVSPGTALAAKRPRSARPAAGARANPALQGLAIGLSQSCGLATPLPASRTGRPRPRMFPAMTTQCVRFATRATLPAPLAAHLRGDPAARPVEAIPRADRPPLDLGGEPDRAAALLAAALAVKRPGRKGRRAVDVIIAGPPPFESPDAWPDETVNDWATDSAAWLRDLAGVPLHVAALHTDERSPHVHAALAPVVEDPDGRPRLSWKALQARMAERAVGRLVRDNRRQLSAIQDHYQAHVGARYGLERGKRLAPGERGPKYEPPDRLKGLRDRVRDAERREREADEERRRADQRAREADEERRRAEDHARDARRLASAAHQRAESDRRALTDAGRRRALRDRKGRDQAPLSPAVPAPTVERRPGRTRGPSR